ncbi:hypothetical protein [Marinobacter zhanjiangensis]|uniref:Uncharacterized protein n=1 Tax=Marinobacter zhanjiangensis TaxID=578215 RepID=A0ABQ3AS63_9GAMM|nr:hypothetical protein [Marinobacter zhanjiangensis]GGY62390.1 hypothetical protein GCM10007071_06600 [Marinobacter zhanjiangensis]
MNKSLSAAITTMLLITSSAWATPQGQAVRPMGGNMPDPSPTEQADQMRERHQDGQYGNEDMKKQGEQMRDQHSQGKKDPHGDERWKDEDDQNGEGKERGSQGQND